MDLLLGGPGTGKTTELVARLNKARPNRFALLTFTRQAANEAKVKLSRVFNDKELEGVRTIHSLAFNLLKLNRNSVFTYKDKMDFGRIFGFEFSSLYMDQEDGTYEGLTPDDITFRKMELCLVNDDYVKTFDDDMEDIHYMLVRYNEYKTQKGIIDFHDMLEHCIKRNDFPRFDTLFVDEAQDLTPLQFEFIWALAKKSSYILFAGDDDQMIYEWAGVRRQDFIDIARQCERQILKINYRLPMEVIDLSEKIVERCSNRIDKTIHWEQAKSCKIRYVDDLYSIEQFSPNLSYLILVRNKYLLADVKDILNEGELDFGYLKVKEWGKKKSNIQLSTIHGSKGAEADVVILLKDVSPATYERVNTDPEHRVWYVGITRTKQELIIVEPRGPCSYEV